MPGKVCTYCESILDPKKSTIDHLIPISRGGKSVGRKNKVVACSKCNAIRGNLVSRSELVKLMGNSLYQRRKYRERRLEILFKVESLIKERGLTQYVKPVV